MKNKLVTVVVILLSLLSVVGCTSNEQIEESVKTDNSNKDKNDDFYIENIEKNFNQDEFVKSYPDYQVNFEKELGMQAVSLTNHDPYDFANLPDYQELIQYGYVSMESDDIVYAIDIFIKDTQSYYSAEYDAKSKKILSEHGDWTPDGDFAEFISERLEMIDSVLQ